MMETMGEITGCAGPGLRERLRHVYWVGGGSGAGKSTIARRLVDRHGLRLYATDGVMVDHASRSNPADSPFLSEFAAMDMDERWVSRSPEAMLETVLRTDRWGGKADVAEGFGRLRWGGLETILVRGVVSVRARSWRR
jgi:hypothetical protein